MKQKNSQEKPREARADREKKEYGRTGSILIAALFVFGLLLSLSVRWMISSWAEITMEEFLFQMSTLGGTGQSMLREYALNSALPCAALSAAMIAGYHFAKPRGAGKVYCRAVLIAGAALLVGGLIVGGRFLHIGSWLLNRGKDSELISENYVDPADVDIVFPEKKRNLIYIFLESMETTYADTAHGGHNEVSRIPNLTALAAEEGNENFSGDSGLLNGGLSPYGTGWTMSAIYAQTTGLPLKISIDGNLMLTQDSFFPGVTALPDVLADQGYRQIFLIGSDATFGGRRLYFETHGPYEIMDYLYAVEHHTIPDGYHVWWGYEDQKLFANAKDLLTELSASDQPFNLTMLTVDSHFPDGYICEQCGDEFDLDYDNAIACSDCQVTEFIRWIQSQPFYENTTVILNGDHPTMKSGYLEDVPLSTRKTYTLILNGAAVNEAPDQYREFTTMDLYPTTLAALGASIEGDRLGLGVNLYSGRSTLVERLTIDEMNAEFSRPSPLLDKLMEVDWRNEKLIRALAEYAEPEVIAYPMEEDGRYLLRVENAASMRGNTGNTVSVTAVLSDGKGEENRYELALVGGGAYQGEVEIPGDTVDGGRPKDCMLKVVSATDKENYQRVLYDGMIRLALESDGGLVEYLSRVIAEPDIAVFLSVRDDAANALSDGMQDMLHALGLKETLQGNFRSDYIAVIDKGEVIAETLSPESIEETGTLSDGTTWRLESSRDADDQNTVSSILIDGEEYSPDRQGINFAVYSYESGQVVQRCCYNTFRNWPYAAVTVDDSRYAEDGTIEIVVEDLDSYSNAVSGWIWNESEPDWKKTLAPSNDKDTPYWRTTVDAKSLVREPGDVLRISFYGSGELYNTMYICGTSWQPPQ